VAALTAGRHPGADFTGQVSRAAEAALWAVGVAGTGGSASPLLPYLVAPAFAGGIASGAVGGLVPPAVGAVAFAASRVAQLSADRVRDYASIGAEWLLIAIALGLIGAWVGRADSFRANHVEDAYAAAYRLLSQLRTVARQLSDGLDPVALAAALLEDCRSAVPYERSAVLVRSPGGRLVPLAYVGGERLEWDLEFTGDSAFAEAWASQRPEAAARQHVVPGRGPRPGSSLAIPLRIGVRTFGLAGFETETPAAYPAEVIAEAERLLDVGALRLESALLFDELREVATTEERRRLAREIHDGIAQELASLGYAVDELSRIAGAENSTLVPHLRGLREEVSRIVGELRLSMFDLRSEVDQHGGLGAALSEYVRTVGTSSPFVVHLSLDERPTRLPAQTEAELLRIAQEAVTNARKHAGAHNLWVHCSVDPPRALLRIEDDGVGLGPPRADSYGLEIMHERAARLRARLTVTSRDPQGTVVEVRLGPAERHDDTVHAGERRSTRGA